MLRRGGFLAKFLLKTLEKYPLDRTDKIMFYTNLILF